MRDTDTVALLLSSGVDVNGTEREHKMTALMFAARQKDVAIVKLLLEAGADINQTDEFGKTSLAYASRRNTQVLLERGVHIDHQDSSGNTALHQAIYNADFEKVDLLIAMGADFSICDEDGLSPLDVAEKYGFTNIAERIRSSLTGQSATSANE